MSSAQCRQCRGVSGRDPNRFFGGRPPSFRHSPLRDLALSYTPLSGGADTHYVPHREAEMSGVGSSPRFGAALESWHFCAMHVVDDVCSALMFLGDSGGSRDRGPLLITPSVLKSHIQIPPSPMILKYQATTTDAQKCQIRWNLPGLLSSPPSTQIWALLVEHSTYDNRFSCLTGVSPDVKLCHQVPHSPTIINSPTKGVGGVVADGF